MRDSKDIDLMVAASLMPSPDGMLLLAASQENGGPTPRADVAGGLLLLGVAALVAGLLSLLPAGA